MRDAGDGSIQLLIDTTQPQTPLINRHSMNVIGKNSEQ